MVCDLSGEAILGMDIMASHLQDFPYEVNMRDGLLTGPRDITVILHRWRYIGRKTSTKSTVQRQVKPGDSSHTTDGGTPGRVLDVSESDRRVARLECLNLPSTGSILVPDCEFRI